MENPKYFKIRYSPDVYKPIQGNPDGIPAGLADDLSKVYRNIRIGAHNPKRRSVSASIPTEYVKPMAKLPGIISITEDIQFDVDEVDKQI